MKVYHVCNDMSLELSNEEAPTRYNWVKRSMIINGEAIQVELGYCMKHKELHFLRMDSGINLEGKGLGIFS